MIDIIVVGFSWVIGIGAGIIVIAVCMAGLYLIACLICGLVKGLIKGFKPPSKNKEEV